MIDNSNITETWLLYCPQRYLEGYCMCLECDIYNLQVVAFTVAAVVPILVILLYLLMRVHTGTEFQLTQLFSLNTLSA